MTSPSCSTGGKWVGACALSLCLALLQRPGLLLAGDAECPPQGTTLRWENFGLDFFNRNCNLCHNWSRYSYVYQNRFGLLQVIKSGIMPPIQKPSAAEVASLEEWMACDMPLDGPTCPPHGTYVSYDSFARGFFEANCTSCHSKQLFAEERNGAPAGYDWDDYASVALHGSEIRDQLEKQTMPPGGSFISPSDTDRLAEWIACGEPESPAGPLFRRGDTNADGSLDITDAVNVLSYLFQGEEGLRCLDALDADGTGVLNVTDAIFILRFLFLAELPPPEPFEICGSLPLLGCQSFEHCGA